MALFFVFVNQDTWRGVITRLLLSRQARRVSQDRVNQHPRPPRARCFSSCPRGSFAKQVLAGYLMFGTVSGIMMALFLDNVGGAWDNAKKYVEVTDYHVYDSMARSSVMVLMVAG